MHSWGTCRVRLHKWERRHGFCTQLAKPCILCTMLSPLHIVRNGATTRRIIIVISYAVVEVFSPNLPPNGHWCIYAICSRPIGFSQYGTFCCARLASFRINPQGRSKHIFSIQLTADYIEPGRPTSRPGQRDSYFISYWYCGAKAKHTITHTYTQWWSWKELTRGRRFWLYRTQRLLRSNWAHLYPDPRINHQNHNFMSHTQSVVVVAHFLDDEVLRIIIILIIILL